METRISARDENQRLNLVTKASDGCLGWRQGVSQVDRKGEVNHHYKNCHTHRYIMQSNSIYQDLIKTRLNSQDLGGLHVGCMWAEREICSSPSIWSHSIVNLPCVGVLIPAHTCKVMRRLYNYPLMLVSLHACIYVHFQML